jgi:hypothetical protein
MLKYTRNTVIAFDFKDALSFEGETGPYIQYATVRIRRIFENAGTTPEEALSGLRAQSIPRRLSPATRTSSSGRCCCAPPAAPWSSSSASPRSEPAHLAKHAFQLAQEFASFYNTTGTTSLPSLTPRGKPSCSPSLPSHSASLLSRSPGLASKARRRCKALYAEGLSGPPDISTGLKRKGWKGFKCATAAPSEGQRESIFLPKCGYVFSIIRRRFAVKHEPPNLGFNVRRIVVVFE